MSIGNLVAALRHILQTETADSGSFVVADDTPVTMAEIIRAVRHGLGSRALLLPVPEEAVAAALRLTGKADFADRLTGELVVDAARLRSIGWSPPETTAASPRRRGACEQAQLRTIDHRSGVPYVSIMAVLPDHHPS